MTDAFARQRRTQKAPNHIKHETSARPTYCVFDTTAFQMASKRSTVHGHTNVSNFEKVTVDTISELDTKKIGEIGRTKRSQKHRQRTKISKKKKRSSRLCNQKTKFNKLLPRSSADAEWKHVLGDKNELTQCPRHADVFTYPRRPSVHTGHPAGTHTSTDKRFLVMRCVCAKNKTYVTSYT